MGTLKCDTVAAKSSVGPTRLWSRESCSELSGIKVRGPGFCTAVMGAGCPWRLEREGDMEG